MIDFTRELMIPSENPPGNEYALCAVVIAQKLKQIGLEPQVVAVPAIRPGKRAGILRDGVSRGRGRHAPSSLALRRSLAFGAGPFNPMLKGLN
jgi:hypothetical protein